MKASSMNNFDIVRKFPTASLRTGATNKVLTSTWTKRRDGARIKKKEIYAWIWIRRNPADYSRSVSDGRELEQ